MSSLGITVGEKRIGANENRKAKFVFFGRGKEGAFLTDRFLDPTANQRMLFYVRCNRCGI